MDGVLLLHISRPPAVFEVIDALAAHVLILDPAKINPQVRELMDKERAGVQELVVVDFSPLIGGGPGGIAFRGQRMRRRTQAEQVEKQRLVIALPAIRQKAALRLPTVRDRRPAVLGPLPVGAPVQLVGQRADFAARPPSRS